MYEPYVTYDDVHQFRPVGSTGIYRSAEPVKPVSRSHMPQYNVNHHLEQEVNRPGPPHFHPSSANSVFPRSASEALFDATSKFRQLPCRTFISVGTCPYRERCVYLHDPRCICKDAKTKTRRKNKEDVVMDGLFWPIMPVSMVSAKLDMSRQPHVIQPYSVPMPQRDQYHRHDAAVYSMWMHFVDFCMANAESTSATAHHGSADVATCYCAPDAMLNGYTEEPRLHVFRFLSSLSGREVSREEFLRATAPAIPPYARHVAIPVAPIVHRAPPPPVPSQPSFLYQQQADVAHNPYQSSADAVLLGRYDAPSRGLYGHSAQSSRAPSPPTQQFPPAQQRCQQGPYSGPAADHARAYAAPQVQHAAPRMAPKQLQIPAFNYEDEDQQTLHHQWHNAADDRRPSPVSDTSSRGTQQYVHIQEHLQIDPSAPATSLSVLMTAQPPTPKIYGGSDSRKKLTLPGVYSGDAAWESDFFGAQTDGERDSGSSLPQERYTPSWRPDASSHSSSRTESTTGSFSVRRVHEAFE